MKKRTSEEIHEARRACRKSQREASNLLKFERCKNYKKSSKN